jgi:hypothetical protein
MIKKFEFKTINNVNKDLKINNSSDKLLNSYKQLIEKMIGKSVVVYKRELDDDKLKINCIMPNNRKYCTKVSECYTEEELSESMVSLVNNYFRDLQQGEKYRYATNEKNWVYVLIMIEYNEIRNIQLYDKQEDAIEALENWGELSYEEYLQGNIDNKFSGSKIVKRMIINNKSFEL